VPTVRLTEIFRQAAASLIVTNAHRIHEGLPPELGAPPAGGRPGRRKQPLSFAGQGDCPFCAAMARAAEAALDRLAAADGGAGPLCLPHLCAALGLARGRDRVSGVARAALRHFGTLEQELGELIRKSDYRFRGEPRGREGTSWTRAARLLAGAPGVRWSLRQAPEIEG
jgi:hypothetical protein